jgi:hypothetical protein
MIQMAHTGNIFRRELLRSERRTAFNRFFDHALHNCHNMILRRKYDPTGWLSVQHAVFPILNLPGNEVIFYPPTPGIGVTKTGVALGDVLTGNVN